MIHTRALGSLDDAQIAAGDVTWNRRWLRLCAVQMDARTRVGELRTRVTALRDQARCGEHIVLRGQLNPLP